MRDKKNVLSVREMLNPKFISQTCDKCVSIESLELVKLAAIYDSGNDLPSNKEKKTGNDML